MRRNPLLKPQYIEKLGDLLFRGLVHDSGATSEQGRKPGGNDFPQLSQEVQSHARSESISIAATDREQSLESRMLQRYQRM
ncbi:protein of unknown function [Methylocaldum szegediense]|uniref:Uncharacterized protein n=1 Tax=Methylocaldum szegediense TaxID=73780 RepID=A0ABM9HZS7_9GAMM|nr:protein of unknown function [Methylocaldum szegediense]